MENEFGNLVPSKTAASILAATRISMDLNWTEKQITLTKYTYNDVIKCAKALLEVKIRIMSEDSVDVSIDKGYSSGMYCSSDESLDNGNFLEAIEECEDLEPFRKKMRLD